MTNVFEKKDYIPLETAKNLIVTALQEFSPELGRRAAGIFADGRRTNIIEEREKKTGMMQCRPAKTTIDDVKLAGMFIPDFKKRFAPYFTRQDNPEDFAIVDYEYVGTPHSVAYLAHELGHAIADDIQREPDRTFRDFSLAELEEQAYFVQRIVQDHLDKGALNPGGEKNLRDDFTVSSARADQLKKADQNFQDISKMGPSERSNAIIRILGGNPTEQPDHIAAVKPINAASLYRHPLGLPSKP